MRFRAASRLLLLCLLATCPGQAFATEPPPEITCPSDITEEATGPDGAVVDYTVTATDDGGPPMIECVPLPTGATFPLGTTTVTCTATDGLGNTATCAFNVQVIDVTPPELVCPVETIEEATGPEGAVVDYTVTATDDVDGDGVDLVCEPPSGAAFPLGMTPVTCTATDSSGNTATCAFNVQVIDVTPPELVCPVEIVEEATGPEGAVVDYAVTATDDVDGDGVDLVCEPPSGSTFPLGMTPVTCTATDSSGNATTCEFPVRVEAPPSRAGCGS